MTATDVKPLFQDLPLRVLAPLPLPLLQPALWRIVTRTALCRPELFDRLGPHKTKTYLIDPLNMPFVFLLSPDPEKLRLRACRRSQTIVHDARIAGTFLTLLDMVDGRLDGDALFFTRDLIIEGDTEAVVVLRNALDDLEGSIADDIAAAFGFPARIALAALRRMRGDNYAAS
jgi:predicted lipid carrier protein YhbT